MTYSKRALFYTLVAFTTLFLLKPPSLHAGVACDGTDDVVNVANEAQFDCTDATCSFSAWIKTSNSGAGKSIFSKNDGGNAGYYIEVSTGGLLSVSIRDTTTNNIANRNSVTTVNSNTWRHVGVVITTDTVTKNNNVITLYVDGAVDQGSLNHPGTLGYTPNAVGPFICRRGSNYLASGVTEIRYFSGDITAAFMSILASSKSSYVPIPFTQILHLPLECGGSGSVDGVVFPDRSGNVNTGTAVDGANNTGMTCDNTTFLQRQVGVE